MKWTRSRLPVLKGSKYYKNVEKTYNFRIKSETGIWYKIILCYLTRLKHLYFLSKLYSNYFSFPFSLVDSCLSLGIPVSSTYKTNSEDITNILLKVALTPYSILSVALAWNGTKFSLGEVTQKQKYERMKSEVPFFSIKNNSEMICLHELYYVYE
jgi:hypothetical protein